MNRSQVAWLLSFKQCMDDLVDELEDAQRNNMATGSIKLQLAALNLVAAKAHGLSYNAEYRTVRGTDYDSERIQQENAARSELEAAAADMARQAGLAT